MKGIISDNIMNLVICFYSLKNFQKNKKNLNNLNYLQENNVYIVKRKVFKLCIYFVFFNCFEEHQKDFKDLFKF